MAPELKEHAIQLIEDVQIFLGVLKNHLRGVTPQPVPEPQPEPIPTAPVAIYEPRSVTTLVPSFKGARVGDYPDMLIPRKSEDVPTYLLASPPIYDHDTPPRAFPFYVELNFDAIARAHGIPDEGSTLKQRAELMARYIKCLRDHGIEPFKTRVYENPTDWDAGKENGISFRQLVLDGAIHPPCLVPQASNPTDAFLQRCEKAIPLEAPVGSWAYVWDEPQDGEMPKVIALLERIRRFAPSLKTLVTTRPKPELRHLVDIFAPVFDQWDSQSPGEGGYGSCMAQGSCDNGILEQASGTPMMVLDAPPEHAFVYPIMAYALGARMAHYYASTEDLHKARQPGGLYRYGGNGDGCLFYPGDDFQPWPSARLLRIKRGLKVVEALMKSGIHENAQFEIGKLIRGPRDWDHDIAKYERLRKAAEGR